MGDKSVSQPSQDQRFERWLVFLAQRLRERAVAHELVYDGKYLGNRMALAVYSTAGLTELDVHRTKKRGSVIILVSESLDALRQMKDALWGLHRDVKRLHNAKRRFVHRVERMLDHLVNTFSQRAAKYPAEALERLRKRHDKASPMTGIETLWHEKEHEETEEAIDPRLLVKELERPARFCVTRYAARIVTSSGGRAALYRRETGAFAVVGEMAAQFLVVARDKWEEERTSYAIDFAEAALDVTEAAARATAEVGAEVVANAAANVAVEVTSHAIGESVKAAASCADVGFDAPDCSGCDISF